MTQGDFWNERAGQLGHTGWRNAVIYAFDQPARLKSIAALLDKHCPHGEAALDLGTGSGDFAAMLSPRFRDVIAFDVSSRVIEIARKAHARCTNVQFVAGPSVRELPIDEGSLDLVLAVTVLQHIVDMQELRRTLRFLAGRLARSGLMIAMDSTPTQGPVESSYMRALPFAAWRAQFEACGLALAGDYGFQAPDLAPSESFNRYCDRLDVRHLARFADGRLGTWWLRRAGASAAAAADDLYWPGTPNDQMKIMTLVRQ